MTRFRLLVGLCCLAALAACSQPTAVPASLTPEAQATQPPAATDAPDATQPPVPATLPPDGYPEPGDAGLGGGYPGDGSSQGRVIVYRDFEIVTAGVSLTAGAVVTFQIEGGPHRPYNDTAPNDFEAPENLGDGATYKYTFGEPGTVTIRCRYHPEMTATIVVEP